MNLYLDTSALVKLYVAETGTGDVQSWVAQASVVATSRVAYPEARAALARRMREGSITTAVLRSAVRDLDRDFGSFAVVEATPRVARAAGVLAEKRGLRGFDAIHLASAIELAAALSQAVEVAAYDTRLLDAGARREVARPFVTRTFDSVPLAPPCYALPHQRFRAP